MKTIAVISRKGGSGKSTVTTQLATSLALRHHRVLVVDADPQRSVSDIFRQREGPGPVCEISAAEKLAVLKSAVASRGFDVMIIDVPGGRMDDLVLATTVSDLAVIVTRPTYVDLCAAAYSCQAVRQLGRSGLIVLNQAALVRSGREHPSVTKAIRAIELIGMPVSPAILRYRPVYQSSAEQGLGVEEVGPACAAGQEVAGLCNDVARRLGLDDAEPRPTSKRPGAEVSFDQRAGRDRAHRLPAAPWACPALRGT